VDDSTTEKCYKTDGKIHEELEDCFLSSDCVSIPILSVTSYT